MSSKFIFLGVAVFAVIISGYIFSKDNGTGANQTIKSELIPTSGLPVGFTYVASHDANIDLGNSSVKATEGIYRYKEGYFRIHVIKNDRPEALIAQYKLNYQNVRYNPFQDISFNGHSATQVTDYSTRNGKQVPLYTVIWANNSKVIITTSEDPTDAQSVIALAEATGY